MSQGFQQVHIADFSGRQGKHLETPGSSPQEVGMPMFEFTRAGTAQYEPQSLILDKPMDLIENGGNLLDLVEDNRGLQRLLRRRLQFLPQKVRLLGQSKQDIGVEKIVPNASWKSLMQPG
jgi:hypothetical protein